MSQTVNKDSSILSSGARKRQKTTYFTQETKNEVKNFIDPLIIDDVEYATTIPIVQPESTSILPTSNQVNNKPRSQQENESIIPNF